MMSFRSSIGLQVRKINIRPKAEIRRIGVGYVVIMDAHHQIFIAVVDFTFPATPSTTDEEEEQEANSLINSWMYDNV